MIPRLNKYAPDFPHAIYKALIQCSGAVQLKNYHSCKKVSQFLEIICRIKQSKHKVSEFFLQRKCKPEFLQVGLVTFSSFRCFVLFSKFGYSVDIIKSAKKAVEKK